MSQSRTLLLVTFNSHNSFYPRDFVPKSNTAETGIVTRKMHDTLGLIKTYPNLQN